MKAIKVQMRETLWLCIYFSSKRRAISSQTSLVARRVLWSLTEQTIYSLFVESFKLIETLFVSQRQTDFIKQMNSFSILQYVERFAESEKPPWDAPAKTSFSEQKAFKCFLSRSICTCFTGEFFAVSLLENCWPSNKLRYLIWFLSNVKLADATFAFCFIEEETTVLESC